jgi:hypothetical protein
MSNPSLVFFLLILIISAEGTKIDLPNAKTTGVLSEGSLLELHSSFKNLVKSSYGSLLYDMIALQVAAKGPFEFLVETIRALGKDQVESYKTEELRFNERSQLHFDLQDEYNLAISKSTLVIKATKKLLENDLKPTLSSVSLSIKRIKADLEDNEINYKSLEQNRESEKKNYEDRVKDYAELLNMVNKTLEFVGGLVEKEDRSPISTNLLQTSLLKVQFEVRNILRKFNVFHGLYAPFAAALSEVTESKNKEIFSDQKMVGKIIELLNQLKSNFEENFADLRKQEERSTKNFQEQTSQLASERAVFQQKLADEEQTLKSLAGMKNRTNVYISINLCL